MYSIQKLHGLYALDGNPNHKVYLSGFAVIDETGKVVHDGNLYEVYRLKYVAQHQADYLNEKEAAQ